MSGSPIHPPCPSRRFGEGRAPSAARSSARSTGEGRGLGNPQSPCSTTTEPRAPTGGTSRRGPRPCTAPRLTLAGPTAEPLPQPRFAPPPPAPHLHRLAEAESPRRSPREATAGGRARAGAGIRRAAGRPRTARHPRRAHRASPCPPLSARGSALNEGLEALSVSGEPPRQPLPPASAARLSAASDPADPLPSQNPAGPCGRRRRRHLPGYLTGRGWSALLIDRPMSQSTHASRSGGGTHRLGRG